MVAADGDAANDGTAVDEDDDVYGEECIVE